MKTTSRIFAFILTFALMTGAGGCIFQSNKSKMLAHLSEKYNGQEFVPIRMESGGDWFHTSTAILYCYPKGGDPEADKVCATMNLDTKKFTDTYFGILIRDEIEAELLAVCLDASESPLPMKVYFRSDLTSFDESFDSTKTYDDFKEWRSTDEDPDDLDFDIIVSADGTDQSAKEEYAEPIFARFDQEGWRGLILMLFLPAEGFEKAPRGIQSFNEFVKQYGDEYVNISASLPRSQDS